MRTLLQNRQFFCDPMVKDIISNDMAQMRRYVGNTGKITFSAPHNKDGHADITSGICLAVEAAS